jgi:hypothetical protein
MEFSLEPDDLTSLQKGAGAYRLPDLFFKSDEDGCITLEVCDREDPTCNVYAQKIKGHATGSYELYMKMDNVRVEKGGYDIKVSKNLITKWKHRDLNLTYYIALEP